MQVLLLLAHLLLLRDFVLNLILEGFQLDKSVLSEIFRRRPILLNTLKMLNDVVSLKLLLIDNCLELVVLLVDFF